MFQIGEFSKITHVPGSLLRYYDEIGLFKPTHVDRVTGYRYYSVEQLPSLNRIMALKDLGLSLKQITRMLDKDVTTEEIRSILHQQKVQLEQTVRNEMERLHRVEIRLQQRDAEGTLVEQDILLKPLPSQLFFSVRTVTSNWKQVGESISKWGMCYETLLRVHWTSLMSAHCGLVNSLVRKQPRRFSGSANMRTASRVTVRLELGLKKTGIRLLVRDEKSP